MSEKVKAKQWDPIDYDRVADALTRLHRVGVDIRDPVAVVDALESEIQHYQQVVQIMQDKLRKKSTPANRSPRYRVWCCYDADLYAMVDDINAFGLRIVTMMHDESAHTAIITEVPDGEATA